MQGGKRKKTKITTMLTTEKKYIMQAEKTIHYLTEMQ